MSLDALVASSIDGLILMIGWIVGVWFVVAEGVFFYLIFRYRHREGRKGEYITGEEKHQKRWITTTRSACVRRCRLTTSRAII